MPFSEFGIQSNLDSYQDDAPMAEFCARIQDYRAIYSSLIMCSFANPVPSSVINMLKAVTGLDLDIEKLKALGERIYMVKRLFNLKMGITPADDRLPKIVLNPVNEGVLNPVNEGGSAGKTPNFEQLKEAYYKYRTFDSKTGYPKQDKLEKLGLNNL
jgi:aldehyde:ferredoxin oxidoreductase